MLDRIIAVQRANVVRRIPVEAGKSLKAALQTGLGSEITVLVEKPPLCDVHPLGSPNQQKTTESQRFGRYVVSIHASGFQHACDEQ